MLGAVAWHLNSGATLPMKWCPSKYFLKTQEIRKRRKSEFSKKNTPD